MVLAAVQLLRGELLEDDLSTSAADALVGSDASNNLETQLTIVNEMDDGRCATTGWTHVCTRIPTTP